MNPYESPPLAPKQEPPDPVYDDQFVRWVVGGILVIVSLVAIWMK